jgi:hypothetical protein
MDILIKFIIVFVILDIIIIIYVFWQKRKSGLSDYEKKKYLKYWHKICNEDDSLKAVLDSDKLLSILLGRHGLQGSLGEKLKKAGAILSDYEDVWSVHKLRNRIAHDLEHGVSDQEAKKALKIYAKAFKDLGIL